MSSSSAPGIAGLTTAYDLSRDGASVCVLEASGRAGGVILSDQVDDFTIDAGPDSLLVQKPEAIALCRELGLGDRLVSTKPPRLAYIQRDGRLHALPAASGTRDTHPNRSVPPHDGCSRGPENCAWAPRRSFQRDSDEADESIGSFMTRRFGREATNFLAEPLLAGIHAGDVNRLSLKSLFPRFRQAERTHGSVLRAFASQTRTTSITDGAFRSLPGGLTEIACALARMLGPDRLLTNARAMAHRWTRAVRRSHRRRADASSAERSR